MGIRKQVGRALVTTRAGSAKTVESQNGKQMSFQNKKWLKEGGYTSEEWYFSNYTNFYNIFNRLGTKEICSFILSQELVYPWLNT